MSDISTTDNKFECGICREYEKPCQECLSEMLDWIADQAITAYREGRM